MNLKPCERCTAPTDNIFQEEREDPISIDCSDCPMTYITVDHYYCEACVKEEDDYYAGMVKRMEEEDAANEAKPWRVEVHNGEEWYPVAYCDTKEQAGWKAGSGDYHDLGPVRIREAKWAKEPEVQ